MKKVLQIILLGIFVIPVFFSHGINSEASTSEDSESSSNEYELPKERARIVPVKTKTYPKSRITLYSRKYKLSYVATSGVWYIGYYIRA